MAKYQIKIDQGSTFLLDFHWCQPLLDSAGDIVRDADGIAVPGTPNDLTGWIARMEIRKALKDSTAMITLTSDPGEGITIPAPAVTLHSYVKCATTADIDLSGAETIDGVAVVPGDRVLVKNQTLANANGIYDVAAGAWTRSADANAAPELTIGTAVWVSLGTLNHGTVWRQTLAVTGLSDPQAWVETEEVGLVRVKITDEQTELFQSSGVYDLELESPAGDVYRPLEGKMRLSMEVTRIA